MEDGDIMTVLIIMAALIMGVLIAVEEILTSKTTFA